MEHTSMTYFSEFVGSLIFLLGGYGYMCNVSLKKTLVSSLNYIELVFAWSLAVGFGLCVAVIMGGPAYLNPGVVFGSVIWGSLGAGGYVFVYGFLLGFFQGIERLSEKRYFLGLSRTEKSAFKLFSRGFGNVYVFVSCFRVYKRHYGKRYGFTDWCNWICLGGDFIPYFKQYGI